jgi:peptide/nickel transport system ATP-binding protein
MDNSLLEIEDLRVAFVDGDQLKPIVKGVSFSIRSGEVLGIVGQSGSGKSTTIKAILRILSPPGVITGGSIRFRGQELLDPAGKNIRSFRWVDLSIVMQSALNALNPLMTIGDHFVDTIQQHRDSSRKECLELAHSLVEQVRLPLRVINSHPHMLSGGMRQRVCIALALALKPNLVILDECTTALDVIVEREILDELIALREKMGFAILAITHDLPLLAEIADRVAIMADGEIVEIATVEEFRKGGRHPECRRLLAELPNVDGPLREDLLRRKAATQQGTPLLRVSGLNKSFPRPDGPPVQAAEDVSFEIFPGETLALIGESGSGKSTIARIVARLLAADSGTLQVGEKQASPLSSTRCSNDFRRRVQMVFQDPFTSLNPVYTVGEQLARPLKRYGSSRAKGGYGSVHTREEVRAQSILLLQDVELSQDILDRFPHELSGGQLQRVAIARSLSANPDLLIADEPTSMLDLPIRMELLRTLNRIREERGMSILFISHDLAAARYFTDRIMVMKSGRIVEEGKTESIILAPQHPYTKRLLNAASRPKLRR